MGKTSAAALTSVLSLLLRKPATTSKARASPNNAKPCNALITASCQRCLSSTFSGLGCSVKANKMAYACGSPNAALALAAATRISSY